MKILNLVHAYYPAIGGSEYLVQQVSEYLANNCGDDVTVFTTFAYNSALFTGGTKDAMPQDRADEVINNVKIKRFPVINRWAKILRLAQHITFRFDLPGSGLCRKLYYGPLSPQMKKAVETFDADVIVSAPFPLNHMGYGFENRKKAPVILVGCIHTEDRHGFHNPWIIEAIKKADGYVALTPHEKNFLVEQLGIDERKIAVIGVGIDIPPPSPTYRQIREQAGVGERGTVLAFVGQHGLHKGLETLIKAMPLVWHEYPQTHLIIAGGATPFTDSFKRLARFLEEGKQHKHIHFMDNISETQKYDVIEACDIFATPSGFESFGITILEAWTKKKPVIACNIEATRSLITHGETGFLIPYEGITALSRQIKRLIENPDLRKQVGENGFQKLKNNYTREIIGAKYRDFVSPFIYKKKY